MKERIDKVLEELMITKKQKQYLSDRMYEILRGEKTLENTSVDESEEAYWGIVKKKGKRGEEIVKFACLETLDDKEPKKEIEISEEAFQDLINFMKEWKHKDIEL